jgi:murein DD-endopeptidase MepM/ murein hydrolase activator NlpD
MHPFCCPGFTNSDTIVSIIRSLFRDFHPSQLQSFTCPAKGWISSGFGMRTDPVFEGTAFHKGVDIAAPIGTPVYCAADGVVIFCGRKPLLGNTIFISLNQTKLITIYGHLHSITISRKDSVFQGQIIGHVGSTGKSTGPHLHFEVRIGDAPVNPISLLLPIDTLLD